MLHQTLQVVHQTGQPRQHAAWQAELMWACLLQAFDSAVRGLTVGAKEYLQVRSQRLQKSLCEA